MSLHRPWRAAHFESLSPEKPRALLNLRNRLAIRVREAEGPSFSQVKAVLRKPAVLFPAAVVTAMLGGSDVDTLAGRAELNNEFPHKRVRSKSTVRF